MKLILFACLLSASTLRGQSPISPQAAEGKRVFETSCAVGYCHGLDGRAGKGPRLRDKVWSRSYLYKTIVQGIPGSSMPAWGGKLSDEKIAAVISYIFTISQEDVASSDKLEPLRPNVPRPALETSGRALFFDLTRDRNCGVCHRIGDTGSEIAPAFTAMRGTPAQTLLNKIKSQPVSQNNVQVALTDGEEFCGVKAGEAASNVRVYDLEGSGPPVLRTIARNELVAMKPCPSLNVHAGNSNIYSPAELSIIAALLSP
jgi:mono/diheme cytochrome c family protein